MREGVQGVDWGPAPSMESPGGMAQSPAGHGNLLGPDGIGAQPSVSPMQPNRGQPPDERLHPSMPGTGKPRVGTAPSPGGAVGGQAGGAAGRPRSRGPSSTPSGRGENSLAPPGEGGVRGTSADDSKSRSRSRGGKRDGGKRAGSAGAAPEHDVKVEPETAASPAGGKMPRGRTGATGGGARGKGGKGAATLAAPPPGVPGEAPPPPPPVGGIHQQGQPAGNQAPAAARVGAPGQKRGSRADKKPGGAPQPRAMPPSGGGGPPGPGGGGGPGSGGGGGRPAGGGAAPDPESAAKFADSFMDLGESAMGAGAMGMDNANYGDATSEGMDGGEYMVAERWLEDSMHSMGDMGDRGLFEEPPAEEADQLASWY